jgi:outer membrane protein assembly factor BamB
MRFLFFIIIPLFFFSCSGISIKDFKYSVNNEKDWIIRGGGPENINRSHSDKILKPPFVLNWKYNTDAGYPRNAFNVSDAVVFCGNLKGELNTFDITKGNRLGNISLPDNSEINSLSLSDTFILISSNGNNQYSLFKYDFARNEMVWKKSLGKTFSAPVLSNNRIYMTTVDGAIICMNSSDNNLLWKYDTFEKFNNTNCYFSPVIAGSDLYAGNNNGDLVSFNAIDGRLNWKYNVHSPIISDLAVWKNCIYFTTDNFILHCLKSDNQIVWEKKMSSKIVSSLAACDSVIYVSCLDGKLIALKESDGSIIWEFTSKASFVTSPLLHNDLLFIGSFDMNFYCIDRSNGKELWKYATGGRIRTNAVIWEEFILIASDDENIYCFKNL